MNVRSRRVSFTHAWRGRWSRRTEISSSGNVELWVGTTRLGVVCFAAEVSTLAVAFFLGLPAAGLGAAVGLGSGFLGLAVFLVAVTLGFLERFRDRLRRGIWICGGVVVALTTGPLGRSDSTLRPSPSARQRARSAELSERQGGLWRHSFGPDRAPAL